jgi:hypothetical protein
MRTPSYLLVAALSAVAFAAYAQAAVQVSFEPQGRFVDAGETPHDIERTQAELTRHLQALGQRQLPAGSTLKLVVTEIDLAGEVPRRRADAPRVLNGRADRPRLVLRYEYTRADGRVEPGEAVLSDLDYLDRRPPVSAGTTLPYEKRLIDEWFRQRFGAAAG